MIVILTALTVSGIICSAVFVLVGGLFAVSKFLEKDVFEYR